MVLLWFHHVSPRFTNLGRQVHRGLPGPSAAGAPRRAAAGAAACAAGGEHGEGHGGAAADGSGTLVAAAGEEKPQALMNPVDPWWFHGGFLGVALRQLLKMTHL